LARKSLYWYRVTYAKKDFSADFWKAFSTYIPDIHEQYDVTIGYGPGLASLFAMEKVPNGGKKILWVNTNLVRSGFDLKYQKKVYMQSDRIVTVCRNLLRDMQGYYPEYAEKMSVFYDMLDIPGIRRLGDAYPAEYERINTPRILTVGRICEAKALHFVAEAAAILKEKQLDFLWYIIGDGELRSQLEAKIHALHVQDRVVVLGARDNPYPWFKDCSFYVQTSVYEGSCTTITEALIFGKPVVTTDIDIAFEKIEEGKNGLICKMTGVDIAEKVGLLLLEPGRIDKMSMYINNNPIFYGDQIAAFDELIDTLIYE
jgi:glycosyltransferase involved in cell wall biosynthesis